MWHYLLEDLIAQSCATSKGEVLYISGHVKEVISRFVHPTGRAARRALITSQQLRRVSFLERTFSFVISRDAHLAEDKRVVCVAVIRCIST